MAVPTSHNGPIHHRGSRIEDARPTPAPLLAGLALLGAALVCAALVAGSDLTRILDLYLEHLADPAAWMR